MDDTKTRKKFRSLLTAQLNPAHDGGKENNG
jgi:hypothetical protein